MRPKIYELLRRCVEDGINMGWSRAHKYADTPGENAIKDAIEDAIFSELYEWFDFSTRTDVDDD